jgi:restriction endonuclease S subunit
MKWPVKKLGNFIEIVMGQAPHSDQCNKEGEGVVFVKAGEFGIESPVIKEWTTDPLKMAKADDTLICVVGATAGKINRSRFECAIGRSVAAVRTRANEVEQNYLHAFLSTKVIELRNRSQGAAQAVITREMLQDIEIPLPPLAEQQRIAALLDTADRILKQRESAIAKLDQLAQSVFVEMFGDQAKYEFEEVKLGDCLRFINGRAYSQNELLDTGMPIIRIQNLNGGDRWYYSNLKLPEDKYCDYGDLLFAWSATFGPYLWNGKKSIYHYHIWKIESFKNINKTFAFYLLQSITQKIRDASHGASMLHMTKGGMEAWKIKLPSLDCQMRFVKFINQLQPIEIAYKKSLQLSIENTRSLQHQSFAVN